ncbi:MAG TPA: alpha/beta hydrolase-fold protein [Verrucomicrobiae bacterium]|nr:alpha/beta hydrolase-fold protein [Verrucomicrobiae bacterium]
MLTLPSATAARLEVLQWKSRVLENNPLHDSATRSVAIFLPSQAADGRRLPLIYYLPGYGGSPDTFITHSNTWLKLVEQLADEVTPMALIVVDGRTRWGGSQFLNSAAQGNYEDYVCDEIVPVVESHFPAATNSVRRVIAGHSSGGFGALRLGMAREKLFDAVIALSPDSDFPVSHLPLVEIAAVSNTPVADIEKMESGKLPPPKNSDLIYAMGLSAAYAPRGFWHRGQFDWLYDRHGKFRRSVWQRWINNDPLTLVKINPHAFALNQSVYLDGAAQDQFLANVGARKIYEVLSERPIRCTFFEPPGHHGDHIGERLQRGLAWVFQSNAPAH